MNDSFSDWLIDQLNIHGWSYREFGRRIEVSNTHATNIVHGTAQADPQTLHRIAAVFNLPVETVFRKAGLLPERTEETHHRQELLYLFNQLDDKTQETVLTMLKGYVRETTPVYPPKTSISET